MSRWSEGLRDVISGVIHYPHSFYDLFTPLPTITLKAIMATSHELSIPSVLLLQKTQEMDNNHRKLAVVNGVI